MCGWIWRAGWRRGFEILAARPHDGSCGRTGTSIRREGPSSHGVDTLFRRDGEIAEGRVPGQACGLRAMLLAWEVWLDAGGYA